MIKYVKCRETEKLLQRQAVMRLPPDLCRVAMRQLWILAAAAVLEDLRSPPGNRGEVLLEEYLKPLNISQNKLGRDLGVPAQRITDIIRGKRAITVDTALRLARYFRTIPNSGSTSNLATTWKWRKKPAWWRRSIRKCGWLRDWRRERAGGQNFSPRRKGRQGF